MSKRPITVTEDYLINAQLPSDEDGNFVPYEAIIGKVKEYLATKGLEIENVVYRCNDEAQVAQGIYYIKKEHESGLGIMFGWSNSYDKSVKFKCAAGAYLKDGNLNIISDKVTNSKRKRSASINEDVFDKIEYELDNAELFYNSIVSEKEIMESLPVSEEAFAGYIGKLFLIEDVVTNEQLSIIKMELDKCKNHNLWEKYKTILVSLQKAHPRTWIEQHNEIHDLTRKEFSNYKHQEVVVENTEETPVENPNQLDLVEVIKEVELEQSSSGEVKEEVLPEEGSKDEPAPWDDVWDDKTTEFNSVFDNPLEIKVKSEDVIVLEDAASLNLEVPEPVLDMPVEDDGSWPCLSCGEVQGADSVFHDGQLCSKCVNK